MGTCQSSRLVDMLEAASLRKRFGTLTAVDDVSLSLRAGEIVGLLGPNGAGKTTTVSMLAGLVRPDEGRVLIKGEPLAGDTDPIKRQIGLVPQDLALYDDLTARDNLTFFGGLYGLRGGALDRAMTETLGLVGLSDRVRDRVATFSGGMKRRLNLAASLLHDPAILLLDEPTVGVDPQSRAFIFDNLEMLRDQGKALLYTTHYMEEAERLCGRIVIIDRGRVIADDTLAGLIARLPAVNRVVVELAKAASSNCVDAFRQDLSIPSASLNGTRMVVDVDDVATGTAATLSWLARHDIRVSHVASERGNLETVFLTLTGRSLRD
jgi:ABC-2 type transport system ATP-binding protein